DLEGDPALPGRPSKPGLQRRCRRVPSATAPRSARRPSPFRRACQVLRRVPGFTQNSDMDTKRDLVTRASELPLHPQDEIECRRCGVYCDKVVYPAACISRSCPFVYAYEDHGHTYIGCMQKVYGVEIDLQMLEAAEARRPGFGADRATRKPLP